jgi:hypothetical protein
MNIPVATKGDEAHRGFPAHVFPERIQAILSEYQRAYLFNDEWLGLSILTALSAATGAGFRIKVRNRHTEPAIIWAVIVGVSGIAKSHVIDHLFKPFSAMDNTRFDLYQKELDMFEAGDGKGKRPKFFHSVLKNFTLEALAESSAVNPKGSIVLSDEILAFTKNMNAYNKGSDEQYYLSLFNGHGISLSRKTQAAIHTKRSCINIIGTIQPQKLSDLLTASRFDSGFAQRFLFAYPDALPQRWTTHQLDEAIATDYERIITGIRDLSITDEVVDIPLSPNAWQALLEWQWQNNDEAVDLVESSNLLAGVRKKWEGYLCRFALILEMADGYCSTGKAPSEISTESVLGAIELFDYFLSQTEKAFATVKRPQELTSLNTNQMRLYNSLPEAFITAEAKDIADKLRYSERSLFRFLNESNLFTKTEHGSYAKKAL